MLVAEVLVDVFQHSSLQISNVFFFNISCDLEKKLRSLTNKLQKNNVQVIL